jgi:uncharacterized damage-inducible protein DinB
MFQGNLPQLMAAYNQWQNQQLYTAALALSDEQRKADRGAFFQSIHRTLNHIVWGDLNWLSRFGVSSPPTTAMGEEIYADFAQLHAARIELDAKIIAWATSVDKEWLEETVTWTSLSYGFTQTVPRWVQVQQMFNHQTHHRAQAGTLLKQLGVDVGITDIPMLSILNA